SLSLSCALGDLIARPTGVLKIETSTVRVESSCSRFVSLVPLRSTLTAFSTTRYAGAAPGALRHRLRRDRPRRGENAERRARRLTRRKDMSEKATAKRWVRHVQETSNAM